MSAETPKEVRERLETTGHGHVVPRRDGTKTRCGGVGLCHDCSIEAASWNRVKQLERAQ